MTKEKIEYIFLHYTHLMTNDEKMAWKKCTFDRKMTIKQSSESFKKSLENELIKRGEFTNHPQVLSLTEDGLEAFKYRIAKRIYSEHPEEVKHNVCEKCNQLTRTPNAKQCRFCGYTWFEKNNSLK